MRGSDGYSSSSARNSSNIFAAGDTCHPVTMSPRVTPCPPVTLTRPSKTGLTIARRMVTPEATKISVPTAFTVHLKLHLPFTIGLISLFY